MTFAILHSVTMPVEIIAHETFLQTYRFFGEFYESNTNQFGGNDYLRKELEAFLQTNTPGEEVAKLKNYSNDLARLRCLAIQIPLPKNALLYLKENYTLYRAYVKKI